MLWSLTSLTICTVGEKCTEIQFLLQIMGTISVSIILSHFLFKVQICANKFFLKEENIFDLCIHRHVDFKLIFNQII